MPSIQSFTLTYDDLNYDGSFSEGDTLTGKVSLSLSKGITVESLFVKAKGDADVRWSTKRGDHNRTYTAHRRYFKLKQYLITEDSEGTVIPQGNHVYNFSFNIPPESMPSSFRGSHGKIIYKLEAKLSRSWKMDRKVEKELHFVSKSLPDFQSLMSPQSGSKSKEMGFFSKGSVHMDVTVDRKAYAPGETIRIVAKINNSSSSEMTPKFSLIKDTVYRAQSNTKHDGYIVHKQVDSCIPPQTRKDVKCGIKIPRDQAVSIENCDIISVNYYLKAYLDITLAFDPEVMLPVIILPPNIAPQPVGGPSNSDFLPPAVAGRHYPASAHSGSYGYPRAQSYSTPRPQYPTQSADMSERYNNPVPQQPSPYGSPFSSSSSVVHPPPTAPTFHPPPSAPEIHPPPFTLPSNTFPTPPTYNMLPSAPMMNMDFLSQSDEPPPAYSLLFPSSATEESDAKE